MTAEEQVGALIDGLTRVLVDVETVARHPYYG
jgi:hypothetical protein